MIVSRRGQISTEYILIVSFVLFIVLTTLGIALTYSAQMKDTLKFNQIESFSQSVITEAEKIYYSGEPARTIVKAYLPEGIEAIQVSDYFIVFNVSTNSGKAVTAFRSNVNLTGSISPNPGLRVIYLNATSNSVAVFG